MSSAIDEPFGLYLGGTFEINTYPIVARIPGAKDEEYERDRTRFRNLMLEPRPDG